MSTLQTLPVNADAMQCNAGQVGGFLLRAGWSPRRPSAKNENACAEPSRTRRLRSRDSRSRHRGGCATNSRPRNTTAPRTSSSSRSTSSSTSPRWCRRRAHVTRFHRVFAPDTSLRAHLTPAGRRRHPVNDAESTHAGSDARTPAQRRRSMAWTQGLKQVFGIDVATCVRCSGTVRTVA